MKINNNIVRISSINCGSCGAGLSVISKNETSCKCDYCGNINLILKDGKTKVVQEIEKPVPKKDSAPASGIKNGSTFYWIIIIALGVVGGYIIWYYFSKNKDKTIVKT
ncbi:MAG TPA: hypothetical protein VN026_13480 [Bacteroidia bacterium]|jgi:hypothetical protein|nr:hypothetical protein [Bacteroidia bacterium]